MKVRELIDRLQGFQPDMDVIIARQRWGGIAITEVRAGLFVEECYDGIPTFWEQYSDRIDAMKVIIG